MADVSDAGVGDAPQDEPLEKLVGDWVVVPDIAERFGVPLRAVRRMIEERQLLAHRVGERSVVAVPAKFLAPDGPVSALRGTFTVLGDAGLTDEQTLRWLFTPQDTLPVEGAPIDAILAGHKTEVRRRAMVLAW